LVTTPKIKEPSKANGMECQWHCELDIDGASP
jgi:hypothetical protein